MTERKVTRIKGCLAEDSEKLFIKVEVESEADLEKLAEQFNTPILDCSRTNTSYVIDARDRLLFCKKRT